MNLQDVRVLWNYDRWATGLQLDAVAMLTAEQYERDLGSSMGGVRGTLVHIFGAQQVWLTRWRGGSPAALASASEIAALADLRQRWDALRAEVSAFTESLTEDRLQADLEYKDLKGNPHRQPLVDQVQHVINHSTYHRGQVVTLLRQLGTTAPSTDLIIYYRQHPRAVR